MSKTLTQIHRGHPFGHVLIDVGDAEREQRRGAGTVQQLRSEEQPHVPREVLAGEQRIVDGSLNECCQSVMHSNMLRVY